MRVIDMNINPIVPKSSDLEENELYLALPNYYYELLFLIILIIILLHLRVPMHTVTMKFIR